MHFHTGTKCKISGWTQLFQEIGILYKKVFVEQVKRGVGGGGRGRANIALSTTAAPAKIKPWVAYGFSMRLESQLKPFSTTYFSL